MANINKSYLLLAALLAAKTGTAEAVFPSSQCAQIVDCFNQYTEDDNDEADTACCTDSWGYESGTTNFYACHRAGMLGPDSDSCESYKFSESECTKVKNNGCDQSSLPYGMTLQICQAIYNNNKWDTYCSADGGTGGGGSTTPSFSDYCNDALFSNYSNQFSNCMARKDDVLGDAQACCKYVHSSNATYAQYCVAEWEGSLSCSSAGSGCGPGEILSGGACRATAACDVGWYHPTAGTDYCAQCPSFDNARWNGKTWSDFTDIKGGDTTAGAQAGTTWGLATCYVPTSTAFSDPTGTYEFAWDCYHGS